MVAKTTEQYLWYLKNLGWTFVAWLDKWSRDRKPRWWWTFSIHSSPSTWNVLIDLLRTLLFWAWHHMPPTCWTNAILEVLFSNDKEKAQCCLAKDYVEWNEMLSTKTSRWQQKHINVVLYFISGKEMRSRNNSCFSLFDGTYKHIHSVQR